MSLTDLELKKYTEPIQKELDRQKEKAAHWKQLALDWKRKAIDYATLISTKRKEIDLLHGCVGDDKNGGERQQDDHPFGADLPAQLLRQQVTDQAFALRRAWRGHRLSGDDLAERGLALACELERLAGGRWTHESNRRLAGHLRKHALHWFWFLIDPTIQATNHWAEQAIRPAVVNRKVWGGNRTWAGAQAQSRLMSVIRTCRQRAIEPFAFLLDVLCQTQPQFIPA